MLLLIVLFQRVYFPPCLFSPQNVQNTLCSRTREAPGRSDDCAMKGLSVSRPSEAWLHRTSMCSTHVAVLGFNQSNLWSPGDVLHAYLCGCVWSFCIVLCGLCETFMRCPFEGIIPLCPWGVTSSYHIIFSCFSVSSVCSSCLQPQEIQNLLRSNSSIFYYSVTVIRLHDFSTSFFIAKILSV